METNMEKCDTCRYIIYDKNEYPCVGCENRYVSLYEPLPDLNILVEQLSKENNSLRLEILALKNKIERGH